MNSRDMRDVIRRTSAGILLKTLVERYISDGQPVGSRALQQYSGLEVSSATIRNVMAELEEMGLISSPHTSAGRVPTALGYRLFIDTLMVVQPMDTVRERDLLEKLWASGEAPWKSW